MMDAVHTKLLGLFDIVLGLFFAGNPPKSAAGNGDLVSSYTQMRQLCWAWVAAAECISYWLTGPAVFKVRLCRMVAVRETLLPVWRVGLRFKCRPKGNELLCKQNSCQRDIDVLVYLLSRQLLGSEERSSKASILVDNCPHRLPPQSPFNPFSPENGHIQITGKVLVALMDDHEPISRVPPENTRWCFISRGIERVPLFQTRKIFPSKWRPTIASVAFPVGWRIVQQTRSEHKSDYLVRVLTLHADFIRKIVTTQGDMDGRNDAGNSGSGGFCWNDIGDIGCGN